MSCYNTRQHGWCRLSSQRSRRMPALLLAAFKQATELERRMAGSEKQVVELNRVLSETAASYRDLQQEHAATLEELAWYKRWAYGRRRERLPDDQGQGHLFALDADLPAPSDPPQPGSPDETVEVRGHCRQRERREIDWDKLPQSAMNTTCQLRRRPAPAAVGPWTASGRTSLANWNSSRQSWKPTSMSVLNTLAAAARRESVQHRFRNGRFLVASPGRGWLPRCWSASSATIYRSTVWKTSWPARASILPAARSVTG